MADNIRAVDYFYTTVPNRAGEGARVLGALRDQGVNLVAVHAFPSGRQAQIDFVPEDAQAFKAAARQARIKLSARKTAFLVDGDDRRGAIAALLQKLGDAGVNVTATTAVRSGAGRYGALLWVDPRSIKKAAKALGATQAAAAAPAPVSAPAGGAQPPRPPMPPPPRPF